MDKRELSRFREMLLELRERLTDSVGHLQNGALRSGPGAANEVSDVPAGNMAEGGSDAFLRDLMIRILQSSDAELCDVIRTRRDVWRGIATST